MTNAVPTNVPVESGATEPAGLSPLLISVLALACGVAVANVYFAQAITPLLARQFRVSEESATFVATLTQFGYAAGIFFLLPLGDRVSRRPLITVLFVIVAASLLASGFTSSLTVLCVLAAAIGVFTVVPQVLIPMSADLAAPGTAGRVVATLSAGLIGGILLARVFSGVLGEWLGWRAPYLVAGGLALVLAVTVAVLVPSTKSSVQHAYAALLASSVRLFATLPDLRRSCFYQFVVFGSFTASWTSVALYLTGPHFGYGTSIVGLVALAGAVTIFAVPRAGRVIDAKGPDGVSRTCFAGLILTGPVLLTGLAGGIVGVIGLCAGLLLLDLCVQGSQVANQSRIFALAPEARSRLNSVYMTSVFLGGSAGSWAGARLYVAIGWPAVCGLVSAAGLVTLARHLWHGQHAGQLARQEM